MKKGPLTEKQVVEYLRTHGFPNAERRVMGGNNDRGDVAGIPGWTLEVKNTMATELAQGVDEAAKESENAGTTRFAFIKKRRGKGIEHAFCILPLWLLAELMRED